MAQDTNLTVGAFGSIDAPPRTMRAVPSWLITVGTIVALLVIWEYFGRDINPIFGSYPTAIASAFLDLMKSGLLVKALIESLESFAVGYSAAVLVGIPLGLLIGRYRVVEAAIGLLVTGAYAMPLVALVPLLVLWFGLGFAVKAAVVFLMAVFPVCINTWLGVRAVPNGLLEVGKSFVAPDRVVLLRIILPSTIPYVMAGVKLAVGRGVVAMIIAEFFTAMSGLGAIIINSANAFDTARMFVPVIVLMVLAALLNAFVGLVERRIAPWQSELAGRD